MKRTTKFFLLLILLFNACLSRTDSYEQLFKQSVDKLKSLIEASEKIPRSKTTGTYEGKPALYVSSEEMDKFVEQTEKEWNELIRNLAKVKSNTGVDGLTMLPYAF